MSVPIVAFADLREFIAHLDKRGQIRRVTVPVSRDLEIAEITDRVSKGPAARNVALLFENVRGFDIPVLINAFGAPERMAAALGVEYLDELGGRVAKLLDLRMPGSLFGMQRIIAWEAPFMGWRFVTIRVVSSLAFPVIAGWLVKLYYHE